MNLYDLRTEYRVNPIGITSLKPRFSWKINSEENNTVQKSYHIVVKNGDTVVFDSGVVESSQSVLVEYAGNALLSETLYDVEVEVVDNHNHQAKGEMTFETAILDNTEFKAEMITHDFAIDEKACPVFEKEFNTDKEIASARLYATAHGVYEVHLNGHRVGEDRMTPGWTSYHNRLQYQTYDVTALLNDNNKIEMTVGNGWYKGILGFTLEPNRYGDHVGAFAQLHITYKDGTKEVIATDDSWDVRTGTIRYSEIYMGETINTFDPEVYTRKAVIKPFDKSVLTAQENEPVRITERISPKKFIVTPKGENLVDFGQNITGLVEVKVKGEKGQKIVIRHAEVLDKDGNFYPETLRSAKSIDTYICNGQEQTFLPHFTFHGFRYICVEGLDDLSSAQFTACAMHSDMQKIGEFSCSNKKVNQLQSNISWGLRDNFLDIPTDCPQRDERLGWTGDAQVFSWTASYNRNTALFFMKWMRDMSAESSLEKGVPHVCPDILGQYSASAWSDVACIVPWVVYQTYGDNRILEENWRCMHEWVDYITNHCGENGLWQSGFQYGDWLALDKEESADRTGATDKYMIANAYYIYVTDIVRQAAVVLGKKEEADKYAHLYEMTLESFRDEYYTKTGRIVSETQTGAVVSLYFNLARDKDRKRILNTLLTNIANHKDHLSTGFVGTPYICHALSENGAHEKAAKIFMREDYPSWLYSVNMGATTIWERWNSIHPDGTFDESGMNSLNHYAYGSIGDWMYRKVAGISQLEPGYKKFKIEPMFVKGIESVHGALDTVYGRIVSDVTCRDGKISIHVEVPANTTAIVILPEKEGEQVLGSGSYDFEYVTETSLLVEKFSMESTLGEVIAEPLAVEIFNSYAPGMLDNPLIKFAFDMSLSEMLGQAPEAKPLYEAVINALNKQEKKMDKITLWNQEEYNYEASFGFIPSMRLYIHEDEQVRPCILIAPGGGYCVVSPSEGEIVAKKFYDMGYQAAVITYTTNLIMSIPLKLQPMKDLMRAIRYVRKHAVELKVIEDQIILCGFSAGAHAVGTVGVHFEDIEDKKYSGISGRPDALILSYPVITSGDDGHRNSFNALLGFAPSKEDLNYMSLEKHVSENTPSCFIWQTATDELVPVKNSYLFANALQEHHIPYSLHIFSKGPHGLSLADETWANEEFGEPYTLEQTFALMKAVEDDLVPLPDEVKQMLLNQKAMLTGEVEHQKGSVWDEVKVWPELADKWLKKLK